MNLKFGYHLLCWRYKAGNNEARTYIQSRSKKAQEDGFGLSFSQSQLVLWSQIYQ